MTLNRIRLAALLRILPEIPFGQRRCQSTCVVDDVLGVHVEQTGLPRADQFDESTDGDEGVHAQTSFVCTRYQMWLSGDNHKFSRLL